MIVKRAGFRELIRRRGKKFIYLVIGYYAVRDTIIREFGQVGLVRCFPAELSDAVMSVLRNAIESIDKQGEIHVKTTSSADTAHVEITDTGYGIPQEKLHRLFDFEFTTKGKRIGVGMGLPIAYNTINKHAGTINLESEVGQGTTVKISLPRD